MGSDEISEEIRDLDIDGVSRMAAQSCWNFLSKSSCFRFSWYSLLEIRACFCGRWLDGKILFPPALSLSLSFVLPKAACLARAAQKDRHSSSYRLFFFLFFFASWRARVDQKDTSFSTGALIWEYTQYESVMVNALSKLQSVSDLHIHAFANEDFDFGLNIQIRSRLILLYFSIFIRRGNRLFPVHLNCSLM